MSAIPEWRTWAATSGSSDDWRLDIERRYRAPSAPTRTSSLDLRRPPRAVNLLGLLAASMETKTSRFAIFSAFFLTCVAAADALASACHCSPPRNAGAETFVLGSGCGLGNASRSGSFGVRLVGRVRTADL